MVNGNLTKPGNKFVTDVGWVFASSIVTMFIAFWVRPVLARWIGADGLGLYTLGITILSMAMLVANLGIGQALLKFVADDAAARGRAARVFSAGFLLSLLLGAIVGGVLYAVRQPLAVFFDMPPLANLIPLIALALPFTSVLYSARGLFNGLRQMRHFAALLVLESLLKTALVIALASIYQVKGAILGVLLAEVVTFLLSLLLTRRYFSKGRDEIASFSRQLLAFGSKMFTGEAANVVLNQADIIMIGYFMQEADVGYYGAAVFIVTLLSIVPSAVQRITFPVAASHLAAGRHADISLMVNASMKYCAVILIPAGLVLGFFAADWLKLIFTPDFTVAALPLIVLLVAKVVRGSLVVPIGNVIPGMGRPDINMKLELLMALLNVGLNAWLIPRFGLNGAALATTISLLIGGAIYLVIVVKLVTKQIDFRWHGYAFGGAAIAVLAYWGLIQVLNHYLAGVIMLLATVAFLIVLLGREDRRAVLTLVLTLVRKER